jgi:hypothetical protein
MVQKLILTGAQSGHWHRQHQVVNTIWSLLYAIYGPYAP